MDCLVDSDQEFEAYEELEDDFVLKVNDNKPALVPAGQEDSEKAGDEDDENMEGFSDYEDDSDADREFANKNVKFLDENDDPELKALNEYRLKMAALLPQLGTSVPPKHVQDDLDANFDKFMEEEYADDQIGELDEGQI